MPRIVEPTEDGVSFFPGPGADCGQLEKRPALDLHPITEQPEHQMAQAHPGGH
jgi:hypothetical protein